MNSLYEVIVIIVCLTALSAYMTERFTRLPTAIGVTVFSLIGSLLLVFAGKQFPVVGKQAAQLAASINFPQLLMQVMLGLLLFAGSMQVSESQLKKERVPVTVLSTVGTMISVVLVGTLVFWLLPFFDLQAGYIECLLFGAIISPTDPIAVLSILRQAGIPKSLEVKITGESLFNDGVAVVIFVSLAEIMARGMASLSAMDIVILFARQALGGVAYGLILGYLGFRLIKPINNPQVEVMLTIALAMGGYALADVLHVSGPIAMVVTGIMIGNKARRQGMSARTQDYLSKFWELIDELMNAVLFLLIGLEMLTVKMNVTLLLLGSLCIILLLAARWISVALPVAVLRMSMPFEKGVLRILTWGGLRGGISIALALSLPAAQRELFAPVTYLIVIFSILVQGLTIDRVARAAGK